MTLDAILELVKQWGAPILFAVFWWLEREERKDAQRELAQVAKDTAVAMVAMKETVNRVISLLDKLLIGK